LFLYSNQLTEIPPEIGNLTNLTQLHLFSNQLTILPDSICNLNIDWNNYEIFSCGDNYICDDIPECIIDSDGFNYGYDWDLEEFTYQPQNCDECTPGDINGDSSLNILDLVLISNLILDDDYNECGDTNSDGELNILDLVTLVNVILDN